MKICGVNQMSLVIGCVSWLGCGGQGSAERTTEAPAQTAGPHTAEPPEAPIAEPGETATASPTQVNEDTAWAPEVPQRPRPLDATLVGGIELVVTNRDAHAIDPQLNTVEGGPLYRTSDIALPNGQVIAIGYQLGRILPLPSHCDDLPCPERQELNHVALLLNGPIGDAALASCSATLFCPTGYRCIGNVCQPGSQDPLGVILAISALPDEGALLPANETPTEPEEVISAWLIDGHIWFVMTYSVAVRPSVSDLVLVHLYDIALQPFTPEPFELQGSTIVGTGYQEVTGATESRIRVTSTNPLRAEVRYRLSWIEEIAAEDDPSESLSFSQFSRVETFALNATERGFVTSPSNILRQIIPAGYCRPRSQCGPGWNADLPRPRWPRGRPLIGCTEDVPRYCPFPE